MQQFFITYSDSSNLKGCYSRVEAENKEKALEIVLATCSVNWASMYDEIKFRKLLRELGPRTEVPLQAQKMINEYTYTDYMSWCLAALSRSFKIGEAVDPNIVTDVSAVNYWGKTCGRFVNLGDTTRGVLFNTPEAFDYWFSKNPYYFKPLSPPPRTNVTGVIVRRTDRNVVFVASTNIVPDLPAKELGEFVRSIISNADLTDIAKEDLVIELSFN